MQGKFRVILRIGFDTITSMIMQNTIFRTTLFRIDIFDSWTCPVERLKKISVESCSGEQCRVNSELSFELGLTLSLQWLCKIPFSQLTSFQLTVLIAGRLSLGEAEKKSAEPHNYNREQCRTNSELSFEMGSTLSLQWLCKVPFSQLTLFQLTVLILISWTFPLGEAEK